MVKRLAPLLLLYSSLSAADAEWSGKFWANHLRQGRRPLQYLENNAGVLIAGKGKVGERTTLKLETIGYYVKTPLLAAPKKDLDRGELFVEFNEVSVGHSADNWNVKAGQIITSWGKSDGLNPTDFLSGRRNLLLVPDDQLTRRGHTSVMAEWTPMAGASPWSLQQWIVPIHSRSDVLLNQKLTKDIVTLEATPRSSRIEVATKLTYAGQGWDFDYTYFNGVNKTPVLSQKSFQLFPTINLSLEQNFVHQESHGLNFAKDLRTYVVRFEGAYTQRNQVINNADFIKDPSRIDAVVGLEKSFLNDHRFNFQAVGSHYPSYQQASSSDPIKAQVQLFNKFLLAQHLQTRLGYLLIYYYEPMELNQVRFKLSWLNYFHHESARLLTPQIEYLVSENFQFNTYAMLFDGSAGSPFGVLKQLSSVAVGGSYQF